MRIAARFLIFTSFAFASITTNVFALHTVYVNSSYTDNHNEGLKLGVDVFTTIQDAVTAVDAGGIIRVSPGIYSESITIEKSLTLLGNGPLSLAGASPQAPKIIGGDATGTIIINSNNEPITVVIKNLHITDGKYGIAVLHNARVTIDKNTITGYKKNGVTFGPVFLPEKGDITGKITNNIITGSGQTDSLAQNGIQISEDNTAVISGNRISNHIYTAPGNKWATGILIHLSRGAVISNNTLINNQVGVNLIRSNSNTVTSNTISGSNHTKAGVLVSNSTTEKIYTTTGNIISRNSISGGYIGIWSSFAHGNKYLNNILQSTTKNGIYLWNSSNNTITSNSITKINSDQKNAVGIELDDIGQDQDDESGFSRNNSIINNTVSKSDKGYLFAKNSMKNIFSNNKFNGKTIKLEDSGKL
jgi:parallel beta-helix repeat protein